MPEKIKRDAFLFFGPKTKAEEEYFAQCGPCRMFVPEMALKTVDPARKEKGSRCIIHGSKIDIDEEDSCGFMCGWPTPDGKPVRQVVDDHANELSKDIPGSVTPEISGLVSRRVQCHRCDWARNRGTKCALYAMLNKVAPQAFDLDESITPHSCCNAQTPKGNVVQPMRQLESGSDAADDDDRAPAPGFGRMGGY